MPLYVKLDIGKSGLIHAWVSSVDGVWDNSVAWGRSTAQALRMLAGKIPLPKPDVKKENTVG